MDGLESKNYSWKRITKDEQLSTGECELLYVDVEPSATDSEVAIYNGESTTEQEVHTLFSSTRRNVVFSPPVPVYCRRGLYIDIGSHVTAVFVQWRELGR